MTAALFAMAVMLTECEDPDPTPTPVEATPTEAPTPLPPTPTPPPVWTPPAWTPPPWTPPPWTPPPVYDNDGDGYPYDQDCNDYDSSVYPGAPEYCDGTDSNCDGYNDQELMQASWADNDGDGFGDPYNYVYGCGWVGSTNGADCDDSNSQTYPGAPEQCDGYDNDCDGMYDEDASTWYPDQDQDGFGDPNGGVTSCYPPDGYINNGMDCNDQDPSVYPGSEGCSI